MRKLIVIGALLSARAFSQGCTGYSQTYNITIPTASVGSTLTNFTVMVQGTYPYLAGTGSGGYATNANGYDVVFAQGGALLTWKLSRYVGGTGEIRANVLLPSVSKTTATVFQLCVGKAGVSTFQGGSNPYDSNTKMALNFTSAALIADDTGLQTASCTNCPTYSSSGPTHIGDAATFNGTNQWINLGATPGFQTGNGDRTTSFWVNPVNTTSQPHILSYGNRGASHGCYYNYAKTSGTGKSTFGDCTYDAASNSTTVWPNGAWHRIDIVWAPASGTPGTYYFDGVANGTSTFGGTMATALSASAVGSYFNISNYLNGSVAGLKFANTARSANWIAAEYLNQTNPDPGFYTITSPVTPPVITAGPTCAPNSPSSVYCTWTTDVKSDSQIKCGTVSGGPYTYTSTIINPVDKVTPTDYWGVTSHAMASNGVPNGSLWCIVSSTSKNNGTVTSAEVATATTAPVASRPMIVSSTGKTSRLDDENTGIKGAPLISGQWMQDDFGFHTWADDDKTYFATVTGVGNSMWYSGYRSGIAYTTTDKWHTIFTNLATAWQNGVNNTGLTSPFAGLYFSAGPLSVNGAIYDWYNMPPAYSNNSLSKTTDHYQSTLSAQHNVGPNTTVITNMSCSSGTVTATSLLNVTDELPNISAPGQMAIIIAGATGSNVNGVFGPVTSATSTTITWTQTSLGGSCAGWGWTGGGTINVYGWDVPTVGMNNEGGHGASWVHCDGKDYNCTKIAGMDAFVYFWRGKEGPRLLALCRIRIEDLPTQRDVYGCYTGSQNGDDGLYDSAWDYSASRYANATKINPVPFALTAYGRGAGEPKMIYIPTFNRFLLTYEIVAPSTGSNGIGGGADSWGGGNAIYDVGQYPWSKMTLIGDFKRNVDVYPQSTPQFPQFDARTMAQLDADTVSIGMSNSGTNFLKTTNTAINSYTAYMARDIILTAKPSINSTLQTFSKAAGQEVVTSLELAYDFDVPTGSFSMPNKAPADANQTWAWRAPDNISPLWIDQYGSFNFSSAKVSLTAGLPSSDFENNMRLTTEYTRALMASTTLYCFGHYPTTLLAQPPAGAIALQKSGDLKIAWSSGSNWTVTFMGTTLGDVPIADGSIGCLVVRRDSSNRVTVYNSNAIGSQLPLTPVLGPTTVSGAWGTNPLVLGDATNSFWGIASLLRVWSRDLSDDELIGEMTAVRAKLRARGPGSNIP